MNHLDQLKQIAVEGHNQMILVHVVLDGDGYPVRMATDKNTPVGKANLEKNVRKYGGRIQLEHE